jgi:hypothetical protein
MINQGEPYFEMCGDVTCLAAIGKSLVAWISKALSSPWESTEMFRAASPFWTALLQVH